MLIAKREPQWREAERVFRTEVGIYVHDHYHTALVPVHSLFGVCLTSPSNPNTQACKHANRETYRARGREGGRKGGKEGAVYVRAFLYMYARGAVCSPHNDSGSSPSHPPLRDCRHHYARHEASLHDHSQPRGEPASVPHYLLR